MTLMSTKESASVSTKLVGDSVRTYWPSTGPCPAAATATGAHTTSRAAKDQDDGTSRVNGKRTGGPPEIPNQGQSRS